jgi:hypothetical protein
MTKTTHCKMFKLMFQVILLLRNQKDIFHINLQNYRLYVVTMSILIAVSLVEFRLTLSKYQAEGLLHNLLYILYGTLNIAQLSNVSLLMFQCHFQ